MSFSERREYRARAKRARMFEGLAIANIAAATLSVTFVLAGAGLMAGGANPLPSDLQALSYAALAGVAFLAVAIVSAVLAMANR